MAPNVVAPYQIKQAAFIAQAILAEASLSTFRSTRLQVGVPARDETLVLAGIIAMVGR